VKPKEKTQKKKVIWENDRRETLNHDLEGQFAFVVGVWKKECTTTGKAAKPFGLFLLNRYTSTHN
jgi:hypothetical protein